MPATVQFSDGSVSLFVAEDRVGEWPTPEVDFVDADGAYDIQAEGDSIRFFPDAGPDFGSFVGGEEPPDASAPLNGDAPAEIGKLEPPTEPLPVEIPRSVSNGDEDTPPALGPEENGNESASLFPDTDLLATDRDDEDGQGLLDEEKEEPTEDPGISFDAPDEFYAAGLSGESDLPRPRFQSALTKPDEPANPAPSSGETIDEQAEVTSQEQDVIKATPPDRLARVQAESEPAEETESRAANPSPDEEISYEAPTPAPPLPSDATGDEPDPAPEDGENVSSSLGSRLAKLLRHASPDETETPPAPEEETEHDLPTPISDSDNLRQWMLVSAGGVVLVAILGVVVWGLIAILGGEDQEALAAEQEQVATTLPAPAPSAPATTPATAPPLTTVPAENLAAAGAFVTSWNDLARDYAYHLTISADSLPISTAPAPTVHLTYGEDGILELTMAPKGTGSDRDILVAMGLAVAWGDPSLNPEGRKQLLGSMGIDVDDPQVTNMGGEVSRNGVDYSTTVEDGVIRFRVTPSA